MKQLGPWILIAFVALLAIASYYLSQPQTAHVGSDTTTVQNSSPETPQPHQNVLPDGYGVAPSTPAAPTRFVDVAGAAGLDYRWTLPGKTLRDILDTIGNGCAFIDFDHSGNLDILLIGNTIALYRGDGHGHFSDISHDAGLDRFHGHYLAAAPWAISDNDGFDDVFISGYQTALLLHNDNGKRFRDVTSPTSGIENEATGVPPPPGEMWTTMDVWICSSATIATSATATESAMSSATAFSPACSPEHFNATDAGLYRNMGDGHFKDYTEGQWGVQDVNGKI